MSGDFLEIHRLLGLTGEDSQTHPEHGHEQHIHKGEPQAVSAVLSAPSLPNVLAGLNFKHLLIYPAIFIAAFLFFYTILNFPAILSQVEGFFTQPQAEEILGEDTAEFYSWISNYFYAVNDSKLLEPTNDIDHDGLSNQDEFVMRTNPIIADSDSDGFSDGIEVINSSNPWGDGSMSKKQRGLADKLDLIMINNRISFGVSQNLGAVSGANTSNYNLDTPGRLSIPKLNLSVPLVWSKDATEFDRDLTTGVIHYPGTAMPGENGIVYISGHSSDYIWKRNPMQNVFSKLNYLTEGDDVFVDVYGIDGKVYNFRYQVMGKRVFSPDDQTQFIDTAASKLNLSTCWPIGSTKDRLVVSAVPVAL